MQTSAAVAPRGHDSTVSGYLPGLEAVLSPFVLDKRHMCGLVVVHVEGCTLWVDDGHGGCGHVDYCFFRVMEFWQGKSAL